MLNRLGDYYNDAINGSIVLTKFLDLEEIKEIKSLEKDGLKVYFFGGYESAERLRAIIQYKDYEKPIEIDYKISVYYATFNKKFKPIGHRNVLGSIMSLGIERNTFGDIYINDDKIYLFISNEIEKFLISNMPQIMGQQLDFKKVDGMLSTDEMKEIEATINVASLRLDAIVAKSINTSRNIATTMIESGNVCVNHIQITSVDYKCKISDMISIRKYGRITLLENIKTTKKDRLVIKIGVKH